MVNSRRSEFEIIAKILILSMKGAKKTQILYGSCLSYTQVRKYIPFLVKKEILNEKLIQNKNSHSKLYITTDKGHEFLKNINKTLLFLK